MSICYIPVSIGELYDKESGLLHVEHACTDLAMAIEIIKGKI
jgi:hypothetical protein